jgi:hypothetical protein
MLIDCNSCIMRDIACDDCVVSMLLGPEPTSLESHRDALSVLADAGIVAPLRLIKGEGNNKGKGNSIAVACQ